MLRIAEDNADLDLNIKPKKSVDEMAFFVIYPRCAMGVMADFLPIAL